MRFTGFAYQVVPSSLTLRFVHDDPEGTPPEATGAPVAVLRFSDVQVWQWEDDFDLFETPSEHRGQVSDLGFHAPTNVFSLHTPTSRLLFSAGRLAVGLEPVGRT